LLLYIVLRCCRCYVLITTSSQIDGITSCDCINDLWINLDGGVPRFAMMSVAGFDSGGAARTTRLDNFVDLVLEFAVLVREHNKPNKSADNDQPSATAMKHCPPRHFHGAISVVLICHYCCLFTLLISVQRGVGF
jgi:hypothetical protein